ncbi:hypothetical protein [Carboxylicivirga sp. M1479]|uniref:hypothetical protein n=1 Tax=Carboxylicivirga sp. M1479 TaxID=2594476 RepID=UPI001177EB1E|nr:hypothetical protein [Carboxylicivirga sp. M1479]TRX71502.1 hypothetical protein FNN09_05905 [Carboxylicivirga sp. M1479]
MGIVKTIPSESPYYSGNNDIGDVSNDNGTTFEVSNIDISDIKNVLGEDTYDLSDLCKSPFINKHALFKPSGFSPYNMGDWAGYNHEANPTSYVYSSPSGGGTSPIFYSDGTAYGEKKITYAYLVKRGEKPPVGSRSWDRIKVELTVSGGFSGVFSTTGTATLVYDNITTSIIVPENDEYSVTITPSITYVDTSGNYIADIEDDNGVSSFTTNIVPRYIDAPNKLTDNPTSFYGVRHYHYNSISHSWFYITETGNVRTSHDANMNSPKKGIMVNDLPSGQEGVHSYQYTVFQSANLQKYWKCNLKGKFLTVGTTYKQTFNSEWYKVGAFDNGYNYYWYTDANDWTELSGWPTT